MKAVVFAGLLFLPLVGLANDAANAAPKLTPNLAWAQGLAALSLVVLLIFVAAWLARRYTGLGRVDTDQFKLLGGIALGARERVVVLQAGPQKQLVLGVCPGRIEALCVLEGEARISIAAPSAPPNDFAAQLRRALGSEPTP